MPPPPLPPASRPALRPVGLLGRARELAEIGRAFEEGAHLVTLVGPPGVGKSRLAHAFVDGHRTWGEPCVVDLADVARTEDALAAVAAALGITATVNAAEERIGAVLRGRGGRLLVLDDADRVADSLGASVSAWARISPELRVLVTSRSRLGSPEERVVEVPPLDVASAVTLFRKRAAARATGPRTGDDTKAIAALVEALDRVPLAIEVAAARAAALSARKMLERIQGRIDEVLRSAPSLPGASARRHASLHAAIGLSWGLLSEDERRVLMLCAVLVGSFSVEAAEAIAAGAGDVVGALAALVERSLVERFEPAGLPEEPRFRLYSSVRAYALLALDAEAPPAPETTSPRALIAPQAGAGGPPAPEATSSRAAAEARADAFIVDEADRLVKALEGPDAARAERLLDLDRENLLAAHRRSLAAAPAIAARAGLALSALSALHGLSDTQLHEVTIDAARRAGDPALLVSTLVAFGDAGGRLGLVDPPRRALDEAIALAEAERLPLLRARARFSRGRFHAQHGDFTSAEADLAAANTACAHLGGAPFLEGCVHNVEGCVAEIRGDYDRAVAAFERARASLRRARSLRMEAAVVSNLGVVRHAEGRQEDARALLEQALALARSGENRIIEADVLLNLGSLHASAGRLPEAEPLLLVALAKQRELGHARFEGLALANLAMVAHERGELRAARDRYQEALDRLRACGEARFSAMTLPFFAAVEAALGLLPEARADFAAARALPAGMDPAHEGVLDVLEGFLDLSAIRDTDSARSSAALAQARARLKRGAARLGEERAAVRSAELSVAVRLLGRALAAADNRPDAHLARADVPTPGPAVHPSTPAPPRGEVLVVGPEHRWFAVGSGPEVDLATRGKLRLVLAELVGQRVAAPGVGVPAERLFKAAWPADRALPKAASDRTYNAVSTLRRLGLDGILKRQDDGYLLDPAVRIERR